MRLHFNRKSWTTRAIYNDRAATLGEEAIAYRTMMKYLREAQVSPGNTTPVADVSSPLIDDSDEVILRSLEELPFSPVRQLLRATHLPKTTV
jgi:hypothetical protein